MEPGEKGSRDSDKDSREHKKIIKTVIKQAKLHFRSLRDKRKSVKA